MTVRYVDGKAAEVTQIVLSTQHLDESWDSAKVRKVVEPYIREALGDLKIADDCNWYINPTGKFVIGGPDGDAGLTGRKIIVDTYGGAAPHGGGAFSGKDTTKVDRSAAYAARYLAKNVVAAKLADRCTIQLSYAIGVAQPLSVYVDLHGTGKVEEAALEKALREVMDLSPSRHPQASRPQQADLRQDVGLRPFRPQARPRRLLLLGEDRPGQGAEGRRGRLRRRREPDAMSRGRRSRATEAFFGRRRGKTIRPLQAAALARGLAALRLDLDAPAPGDLRDAVRRAVADVRLEIGFGGGEHLLHEASTTRHRLHRRRALRQRHGEDDDGAGERRRSPISASTTTTRRSCSTGCRSIARRGSTLLYPDPWPKKKHWKRRFVSPSISTASHAC